MNGDRQHTQSPAQRDRILSLTRRSGDGRVNQRLVGTNGGSKSAVQTLERPLPQNLDAERSVLGAILLDSNMPNLAFRAANTIINEGDFFHVHHRIIFRFMREMVTHTDAPIDLVTLTDLLCRYGKLEAASGAAYLTQLIDGVPRVSNVEYYARIVREKARLRQLIDQADAIQQAALLDGEDDAETILERARLTFDQIAEQRDGASWRGMFHTFEEFDKSRDLEFAIEGFLQTRAATMIVGLAGHDKTFIMLSMVKALLTGNKLWDVFEVKKRPARCVYLIPESSIEPFKYRLQLFALLDYVRDERLLVRTLSKGPAPCLSDPRILAAAKDADVFLDTAIRFNFNNDSSENDAADNQRGLAADIFALLGAGARSVVPAHHAPKSFTKETVMTLENIVRGSGDLGAMLATCWGVRQLDRDRNIVYVQNCKPRDFEPCGPFQLVGRPHIDNEGDFHMHKRPGESGYLQDELNLGRDKGGARPETRQERSKRVEIVRGWLKEKTPHLTRNDVVLWFREMGVTVSPDTARRYLEDARKDGPA
jgi:hypothetical protein